MATIKKSKLIKRLLQAAAFLSLAGVLAWVFIPSPIPVKVEAVRLGSFSATLEAEGLTQARDRVVIWAPVAGTPQRMPLALGDPVVVKQIAARFVPDAAAFRDPQTIAYLQARIASATATKNRSMADREQTAAAVNQARDNLRDTQQLVAMRASGAVIQLSQAQVAMKLIFKEMDSMDAAAQLASLDIEAAEAALRQINNEPPHEWSIQAPISGRVLAVAGNGKPLGMGMLLIEIGDPLDLEVIVETSAQAAAQITVGQRVQVQAAGETAVPGRVRRVEIIAGDPLSAELASTGIARIAIEFDAPLARWQALGNKRPVKARIAIASIDYVLKIPTKALINDGQQDVVYVVENGRARKRPVTLSAGDAETAVIGSGLQENQQVILSPGPNIQDGTRVQAIY